MSEGKCTENKVPLYAQMSLLTTCKLSQCGIWMTRSSNLDS